MIDEVTRGFTSNKNGDGFRRVIFVRQARRDRIDRRRRVHSQRERTKRVVLSRPRPLISRMMMMVSVGGRRRVAMFRTEHDDGRATLKGQHEPDGQQRASDDYR